MVLILLAALGIQALSGLVTTDDVLWNGPLYDSVSDELAELGSTIHHFMETGLKILVAVHIIAVLFHTFKLKEPLISAMFHGRKPVRTAQEPVKVRYWLLAVVLVIAGGWFAW